MIKMFIPKFLNNFPQPIGNNPWPSNPRNKKFRIRFHRQCDYLLGFQAAKNIKDLILEKNDQKTIQM